MLIDAMLFSVPLITKMHLIWTFLWQKEIREFSSSASMFIKLNNYFCFFYLLLFCARFYDCISLKFFHIDEITVLVVWSLAVYPTPRFDPGRGHKSLWGCDRKCKKKNLPHLELPAVITPHVNKRAAESSFTVQAIWLLSPMAHIYMLWSLYGIKTKSI